MSVLSFLFPPSCVGCRTVLEAKQPVLCPTCRAAWEQSKLDRCRVCGQAMLDCRCRIPALAEAGCVTHLKLCRYQPHKPNVISSLLFCLKRRSHRYVRHFLASQLSFPVKRFIGERTEARYLVTSVPRSPASNVRYGFDHARLLGRHLAGQCALPYAVTLVQRRHGKEQKYLSREGRRQNAETSIRLSRRCPSLEGVTVLLVDDVVTTGASMARCASLLREAGAQAVVAVSVAQTR